MRGIGYNRGTLVDTMTNGIPWIQFTVGHIDIFNIRFHATEI